jgi:hypothetical protein
LEAILDEIVNNISTYPKVCPRMEHNSKSIATISVRPVGQALIVLALIMALIKMQ